LEVNAVRILKFMILFFLIMLQVSDACVGRVLYVGAVNSNEGQLLSEMIATIINERTGTTVNIRFYKNSNELYEAVKGKQVDILIENTLRAAQLLNKPADSDIKKTYDAVKSAYEKEKGLIWFKPFGFLNGNGAEGKSFTAPVIKTEVIGTFPALPRVVDKLAGAINDETYMKLIKSIDSGGKPKKIARDFLKSKKLI
jgi:osmoprotectant transport system substrate-binding protein